MGRLGTWSAKWEWLAIVVVAAVMFLVSEYAGLPARWGNALLYTVVLFTIMIVSFHSDWRRRVFWRTLGLIFVMHSLSVGLLVQTMPNSDRGIAGLPMTLTALTESCVILGVLWKRKAISRPKSRNGD
jgi:hypothetical protein